MSHLLRAASAAFAAVLLALVVLPAPAGAVVCTLEAKTLQLRNGQPAAGDRLFASVDPQMLMVRQGMTVPAAREFERLVKKEPEYRCATPCKGALDIGEGKLLVALDGKDMGSGYDTLYVDFNRNLDLTDDKPVRPPQSKLPGASLSTRNRNFPPVSLEIADGDGSYTWTMIVEPYVFNSGGQAYAYAQFRATTYREGTVELDGKPVQIVLLDHNSTGRFDDATDIDATLQTSDGTVPARPGDHMLIDPGKNETPLYSEYMTSLAVRNPVGKLACIGGKYYDCKVSPSGSRIELEPCDQPTGRLSLDAPGWQALLVGEGGAIKVMGGKDHPAALPAGEWKLAECTVRYGSPEATEMRDLTFLSAQGVAGADAIKVEAGKTAAAPFGGPYRLRVVASPAQAGKSQLALQIIGRAGEICNGLAVNGVQPAAPTFVMATADGKKVESGAFQFG